MIRSMTGYGKRTLTVDGKAVSLEVKSLNSKQLDVNVRLPNLYRQKEIEIRNMISAALVRGKVDFFISYENAAEMAAGQVINRDLFKAYYKELEALSKEFDLSKQDMVSNILKMPGILQNLEEGQLEDSEWNALTPAIAAVLADLDTFRLKEGAELLKDFIERIALIKQLTEEVEKLEPARVARVRERLSTGLSDLKADSQLDNNRLEQEMILYIERLDITEEIVRLKSHCAYTIEVLNEKETEKGKKLAFISQEIGREINTIGSKANDATIQRHVVLMKEQLEKIKEQLNNIL